jgi:4-amino-4-deoxy-L-arabinose transferase-like glycosyltransferase
MRPLALLALLLALAGVAFGAVAMVDHNRAHRIERTRLSIEGERQQQARLLVAWARLSARLQDAPDVPGRESGLLPAAALAEVETELIRHERRLADLQSRLDRRPRPVLFFRSGPGRLPWALP